MKKSLLFLISILTSLTIQAVEVEYLGLTYDYDLFTKKATLTKGPDLSSNSTFDVVIPPTITVDEVSYDVTTIDKQAFLNNKYVYYVVIPEGVTSIKQEAFKGCEQLRTISLPKSLGLIESNAFYGCTRLAHISCCVLDPTTLTPDNLPSNTADNMVTLYVSEGKTTIYSEDSKWGPKYGTRILEGEMLRIPYKNMWYVCASISKQATLNIGTNEEEVIIPEQDEIEDEGGTKYTVTGIDKRAFYGFSSIRRLTIPESVAAIGTNAFYNCNNISHVYCKVADPEKLSPANLPGNEMMTLYVSSSACQQSYLDPERSSWSTKFKNRIYVGEMSPVLNDGMWYICAKDSKQATLYTGINDDYITIPPSFDGYTVTGIDKSAFSGFSSIVSITIPETVTAIGPEAFRNCSKLAYVYSKISAPFVINTNAFSNKNKAILYIPTNSTYNYNGITGWEFDKKQECNGMEVFQDDKGITYVGWIYGESHKKAILTKGITGDESFEISSSVNSPNVTGYTVVAIGDNAFNGIGGFKNLAISEGIETIGANAFKGRTALQNITFPSTLTTIGDNAFNGCTGLSLITLPANLTSIGDKAFGGCNNIVEIKSNMANPFTFPNTAFPDDNIILYVLQDGAKSSYTNKGWDSSKFLHVFQGDKVSKTDTSGKLTYVTTDSENEAILLTSDPGNVTVDIVTSNPFNTKTVTAIAKLAFYNNTNLTSVVIPNEVVTIAKYAFKNCSKLNGETLPSSLKTIGEYAFENNTSLTSINIPEGTTRIRMYAFKKCTNLNTLTLPSTLVKIGDKAPIEDYAFDQCGISTINCNIPGNSSLFALADHVFSNIAPTIYIQSGLEYYTSIDGWNNYTNYVIGTIIENAKEEGDDIREYKCFYYTEGTNTVRKAYLTKVNSTNTETGFSVPDEIIISGEKYKVTAVSDNAFESNLNKTNITHLTIGSNVTSIGSNAFAGCTGVTDITWPESLKEIGPYAFKGCTNLKVTLPSGLKKIGKNAFENNTSLVTLTIPAGVEKIDIAAFKGCTGITSVSLPTNLKSIGDNAFENNTSLTSIDIPEGTVTIGEASFKKCSNLESVTLPSTLTKIDVEAFYDCPKLATITSNIDKGHIFEIDESVFKINNNDTPDKVYTTANLFVPIYEIPEVDPNQDPAPDPETLKTTEAKYRENGAWDIFLNYIEGQKLQCDINNLTYEYLTGRHRATLIGTKFTSAVNNDEPVIIPGELLIGEDPNPYKVIAIGKAAFGNNDNAHNIKKVTIRGNVDVTDFKIEADAFKGCTGLSEVELPSNLISIGNNAFQNCSSLSKIELPSGLTTIGDNAFNGCSNIKKLYFPSNLNTIGKSAFQGCSGLMEVELPSSLSTIGESAFRSCTNLQKVWLPSMLTDIGQNAFNGCNNITNVCSKIVGTPPTINENVFSLSAGNTATLFVPQDQKAKYTGYWVSKISNLIEGEFVDVYKGIAGDEKDMNFSCYTVENEGVSSMAAILTSSTTTNSVVNIPAAISLGGLDYAVKNIGRYAFKNRTSIKTLTLPASLMSIGIDAFNGCANLKEVDSKIDVPFDITNKNTIFPDNATTLYVPQNRKEAYSEAHWNFDIVNEGARIEIPINGITYLYAEHEDNAIITRGAPTAKNVTIPSTVPGTDKTITAIAESAFSGKTIIESLTLSEGLKTIGANAFSGCSNLKMLQLPASLENIGNNAFDQCDKLTDVESKRETPDNIDGRNVFSSYLAALYVPKNYKDAYNSAGWTFDNKHEGERKEKTTDNGLTYVYASEETSAILLKGASTAKNVTIPLKVPDIDKDVDVIAIDKSAFEGNQYLENLKLQEGLTTIGASAFSGCSALKMLWLPASLATIGNNAFDGCDNLAVIESKRETPVDIKTKNVFSNYSAALYIPRNYKDAYNSAGWTFDNKHEGERVEVTTDDGLTYVYATEETDAVLTKAAPTDKNVTVPDKVPGTDKIVKEIAASAFMGNTTIEKLTLSEGLVNVGAGAFKNCTKLNSMNLPSTLTTIGNSAYEGCKLSLIESKIDIPADINDRSVFTDYTATLYVPKQHKGDYSSNGWNFEDIHEGERVEVISEGLTYVYASEETVATLTKGEPTDKIVIIPKTVPGTEVAVAMIAKAAFSGNSTIESLKFEDGTTLTSIGTYAFYDCKNLKKIWLPTSLTTIGEHAFGGCKSIAYICTANGNPLAINENVLSAYTATLFVPKDADIAAYENNDVWTQFPIIKAGLFVDTYNKDNITYECVVNGEGEVATSIAILLKSSTTTAKPTIPESVELNSVPYKVTSIADMAFMGNTKLVTLVIPKTITSIGEKAFNGCSGLSVIESQLVSPIDIKDRNVFSDYSATLYIPIINKVDDYKNNGWNFSNIFVGERKEETIDGYTYIYSTGDQKAVLTKSTVSSKDLKVPGSFKTGDVTYKVIAIDKSVFKGNKNIVNLTISDTIEVIRAGAFQNCTSLKKVILPSSLKEIGDNAFDGCEAIGYISTKGGTPSTLGNSVFTTSIKATAKLYVPAGGAISVYKESGWKSYIDNILEGELKEVSANDLTYYCVAGPNIATLVKASTSKAEVTIEGTVKDGDTTYKVTEIGSDAFSGNSKLAKVTINDDISIIGKGAFKNCGNLKEVVIPASVTAINDNAFNKCDRLVLVVSKMQKPCVVSDNVFPSVSAKLNIPSGTKELYVEKGWDKYFSIILEGDVLEAKVDSMTYLYVTGSKTATLIKGTPKEKEVTIPTTVTINNVDYSVTAIEESAIANASSIEILTISEGIETIGASAFKNCSNLKQLFLPSSINKIGDNAFNGCKNLAHVQSSIKVPFAISDNVFNTASYDFGTLYVPVNTTKQYADSLGWKNFSSILEGNMSEVTIEGMTYICVSNPDADKKTAKLIKGLDKTKEVKIPAKIYTGGVSYKVVDVEKSAFYGYGTLEKVIVSEGIKTIGVTAFKNCSKLKTVVLPDSLETIGDNAFDGCSKLESVTCGSEKPVDISDNVFSVTALNVNVPTVEAVDEYKKHSVWGQFNILYSMSSISEGDGTEEVEAATYQITTIEGENASITTVAIVDDDNVIGDFTIPEVVTLNGNKYNVTVIAPNTFLNNAGLTSVSIPSTITAIGEGAFAGCSNLQSITVNIDEPLNLSAPAAVRGMMTRSGGSSVFEGVDTETCILYVPEGSIDKYKAADVWKDFKNILAIPATGINGIAITNGIPFDVYNMQGLKVKSDVTTLKGLAPGVYIVKGKKILVK